jgi:hypothetical protein
MAQAITARERPAVAPRPKLRELGVYALPDGRELVVSTIYHDGCSLYTPRAWDSFGLAEYWVDRDGRLLHKGVPSVWKVQDLNDTGRTASYPRPAIR